MYSLFAAVALTGRSFHPVDRWGAYLLLPYLAWVAFASVLNAAIWWMN